MAAIVRATLTDFLRDPNAVVEKLDHGDVVLHRRNAGDLRLSLQSRSEAADEGLRFIARLIRAAFADDTLRQHLLGAALVVPWVTVLPAADRQDFIDDLIRSADAAGELDSLTPVARLVVEWKAVAAGYADAPPKSAPEGRTATLSGRRPAPPGT
jgi:hypothetical protein